MLDQDNRMVKASSNINDLLVMESSHLLRQLLVLIVTLTKLAMVASSKSEYLAILTESYRVVTPTGHLGDVDSLRDVGDLLMVHEHGLFLLTDWLVLVP